MVPQLSVSFVEILPELVILLGACVAAAHKRWPKRQGLISVGLLISLSGFTVSVWQKEVKASTARKRQLEVRSRIAEAAGHLKMSEEMTKDGDGNDAIAKKYVQRFSPDNERFLERLKMTCLTSYDDAPSLCIKVMDVAYSTEAYGLSFNCAHSHTPLAHETYGLLEIAKQYNKLAKELCDLAKEVSA